MEWFNKEDYESRYYRAIYDWYAGPIYGIFEIKEQNYLFTVLESSIMLADILAPDDLTKPDMAGLDANDSYFLVKLSNDDINELNKTRNLARFYRDLPVDRIQVLDTKKITFRSPTVEETSILLSGKLPLVNDFITNEKLPKDSILVR